MDATYEGKTERDILIELYIKMQGLEDDFKQLNANFEDYKRIKSQRVQDLEDRVEELETWKVQKLTERKTLIAIAAIVGFVTSVVAQIIWQL